MYEPTTPMGDRDVPPRADDSCREHGYILDRECVECLLAYGRRADESCASWHRIAVELEGMRDEARSERDRLRRALDTIAYRPGEDTAHTAFAIRQIARDALNA